METHLIYTLDFDQISLQDLPRVGGKNASLGELFNALKPKGIGVLDGFATTADAYRFLLTQDSLEYKLRSLLDFDPQDVHELAIRGQAARAGDGDDAGQRPRHGIAIEPTLQPRHGDEDRRHRRERELEARLEQRRRRPGEQGERAEHEEVPAVARP